MKAVLKFKLPKDEGEYKLATSASGMYSVILEMDQYLRSIDKYGAYGIDQTSAATIRDHLHQLLSEKSITI